MYNYAMLNDLKCEAPKGFYVIPPEQEEQFQVIIFGDLEKTITEDWFALSPDSRNREYFEAVLLKVVLERLAL